MSEPDVRLMGPDRLLARLDQALQSTGTDASEGFITVRHGEFTRFAAIRVHQP